MLKVAQLAKAAMFVGCVGIAATAASGAELLDALRSGDAVLARRLVAGGADVNVADESGATALMYAAIYADASVVGALLDRGADPNRAHRSGATALMWAIPDEAKVRLLVDRGANVNSKSSRGRTPLLIAAGRPGAAAIVRLLLDKGADLKQRDERSTSALRRAVFSGDPEIVRLLLDRGADANEASASGVTPLIEAGLHSDVVIADMLLARSADVNAREAEEKATALLMPIRFGDLSFARRLLARGADRKARDVLGRDLLMAAAASDTTTPEVMRELLEMGFDPKERVRNLHTEHGYGAAEGPFDWAMRRGDTPVTRLLSKASGETARREPPDERARLRAATPRAAIEKALPLLYAGGREFFKRSGCTSCHHNSLPSLAFALAREKGIPVDAEKVRLNSLQSVAWIGGSQDGFLEDVRLPGADTTISYVLWGLASDGHARSAATDSAFHHLAGSQAIDGGWRPVADRPPLEASRVTTTAVAMRAIRAYAIPGRKAEADVRVSRAIQWLVAQVPRTGEEKAMRLLGLAWARRGSGAGSQGRSESGSRAAR